VTELIIYDLGGDFGAWGHFSAAAFAVSPRLPAHIPISSARQAHPRRAALHILSLTTRHWLIDGSTCVVAFLSIIDFRMSSSLTRLLLCLSFSVVAVMAQPPQEIHPWQTECGNYGCFVNWYCAPSTDLCRTCPESLGDGSGGTVITEDDCRSALVLADDDGRAAANETIGMRTYYTNETG